MDLASLVHRVFYWGGWSALVAVGTLALAAVTYTLVRATKMLADRAEADVRAQWTPILAVRDRVAAEGRTLVRDRVAAAGTVAPGITYGDRTLSVAVENVGRGPAFDVQAWLDGWEETPGPRPGRPVGLTLTPGALQVHRVYTTLAPGEVRAFEWDNIVSVPRSYTGKFAYTDMGHAVSYSTVFECSRPEEGREPELRWQRVEQEPPEEGLAWWQRVFPFWMVAPFTRRRAARLYGF